MPAPKKPPTKDQIDKIVEYYSSGMSVRNISLKTDVKLTQSTISKILKDLKLFKKGPVSDETKRTDAVRLFTQEFKNCTQIASILGITHREAKRYTKKHKVPKNLLKFYSPKCSFSPQQEASLKELVSLEKYTIDELISMTGVKRHYIYNYFSDNDLKLPLDLRSPKGSEWTWEDVKSFLAENGRSIDVDKTGEVSGTKKDVQVTCFCGNKYEIPLGRLTRNIPIDFSCGCLKSRAQMQIFEFVKEMAPEAKLNYRGLKHLGITELDIYVENLNGKPIGIEYNGLFYHSAKQGKNKDAEKVVKSDMAKYEACQKADIRLLVIYEDEWTINPDAVKNYLKAVFGKNPTIGARKCHIRKVTFYEIREFMDMYHLQGSATGCAYYGIYLGAGLVGCAVFSKTKDSGIYFLERYCVGEMGVSGGLSKIIGQFAKDFQAKEIVTFSENRLSQGALYRKAGFSLVKEVGPSYWYTDCNPNHSRIHKMRFRLDKIAKKFPETYSFGGTEKEMMEREGYFQIWDCGKKKWSLKI